MPYLPIKGQRIFYEEHGAGFPILFGHSYLWNAAMWQPQVEQLSAHYHCIVPELWGHGRSDAPPANPYTIEELSQDHGSFAQALGLDRFAIVGLSVGGMWGTHLALSHPESVVALVLMDTYVGAEAEETRALYFGMMDAVEQMGEFPDGLAGTVASMFFSSRTSQTNPALVKDFEQSLLQEAPERIPGIVGIGRGIFGRQSLLERLGELQMPTLVVVGADDLPRPPHEAQTMAERIPGARLEIVEDAGHICTLEQPRVVNEILSRFLADSL